MMELSTTFSVTDCKDGIYAIAAPMGEQIYLVLGESSALLIDTGTGIGNLRAVVDRLTNLPLTVVNTHSHPDHAGGNAEFDTVWLHSADHALYPRMCSHAFRVADIRRILGRAVPEYEDALLPFSQNVLPLSEGQQFDLGGRTLQTYNIPGHTRGSIMLLDSKTNALFTGDTVSANEIWLYEDYSTPLQTYYNSLKTFTKENREITALFPGHPPIPVAPSMLESMILCCRRVLLNDDKGEPFTTFAGSGLRHMYSGAKIIYNPEHLYEL